MKNKVLIFIYAVLCSYSMLGKNYYVNSKLGDDKNIGDSKNAPWKTLWKVNQHVFQPGDRILFAADCSFQGVLKPKGSGEKGNVIAIDRYGKGKNPLIEGEGWNEATVLLYNIEYWEVRNLEITNTGTKRKAKRRGVVIRAENFGDCHHIVLENLEIHHVNGVFEKKKGGGSAILWDNKGNDVKTRFVDLQILNCYMHHCDRNAINSRGYAKRTEWHPNLHVVIRGNLIENVPGDGIVPIGCEGALIEYNVIRKGLDVIPVGDAAAGIWPWSSDNTLIQFNEVSDHRAKWDGQAYDADFNCVGTTFQYNYSFDNWGGFMLICNNGFSKGTPLNIGTKNTVVKYNLSFNDGLRPYKAHNKRFFSPVFHITGPVENTRIEKNIVILPVKKVQEIENTLVEFGDWGKKYPTKTLFENNLVRHQQPAKIITKGAEKFIEKNNDMAIEFDYANSNPLTILKSLENNSLFAKDKNYDKLIKFIKHRLKHPDPRNCQ